MVMKINSRRSHSGNESKVEISSQSSKDSKWSVKTTETRKSSSTVHLRLYAKSDKMQQEGRELRQQIEKSHIPVVPAVLLKKISKKEAQCVTRRLYENATKKKIEAQKAAEAAAKEETRQENIRTMNGQSAKELYNRLSSETQQQRRARTPHSPPQRQKSNTIIDERDAQRLFERLHTEKMGKGKK